MKKVFLVVLFLLAFCQISYAIDWSMSAPGEWSVSFESADNPDFDGTAQAALEEFRSHPGLLCPQAMANLSTEEIVVTMSWGGGGTLKPNDKVFSKGMPRHLYLKTKNERGPLQYTFKGRESGKRETITINDLMATNGFFVLIK